MKKFFVAILFLLAKLSSSNVNNSTDSWIPLRGISNGNTPCPVKGWSYNPCKDIVVNVTSDDIIVVIDDDISVHVNTTTGSVTNSTSNSTGL